MKELTRQCLENIRAILEEAQLKMDDIVKTTVFLTDMEDFPEMNKAYADFFPAVPPARSAVQVCALPKKARIEIEAIAVKPKNKYSTYRRMID